MIPAGFPRFLRARLVAVHFVCFAAAKSNIIARRRNIRKVDMDTASRIWVLTDGRAGNEAQALGLAEAVSRARGVEISAKRIRLKTWAAWLPAALVHRSGMLRASVPLFAIADGREEIRPPWPALVIGAGRRSAPVVAAIKKIAGVPAVQILDSGLPATAFDLVIVPSHDRLSGENVLSTIGAMNRIVPDPKAPSTEPAAETSEGSSRPAVAVLIGGPSRSCRFDTEAEVALVAALSRLAEDYALDVTTSRRTPGSLISALRDGLADRASVWSGDGPNPYPAMLRRAVAALVTEDSVNMASECATAGLPVHVFPVTSVARKIACFHQSLAARGASRRFEGEITFWTYDRLAEADRAAEALIERGLA
ncbi:MAG: mitochondrial fission ELM1 family protein [Pseudomonadota bacterium]